jgi:ATP-dependent DNA helicase RecG
MIPDPVEARAALRQHVDIALRRLAEDSASMIETEKVDLKEEAGRRGRDGQLLPGASTNSKAADALAGEVRCFSNTPGGGALILGVDDKTHALIGTALEVEWLRQRIDDLTGVAPVVEETLVNGSRLLILIVAESAEPVEDPDHRLRWRVGDQCRTVDRAEWWSHRAGRIGVDPMAASTNRRVTDVSRGGLAAARDYLDEGGESETVGVDDTQLLTRLGVLRPDGTLSQAGVLVLCPSDRPLIELSRLDVAGGDVTLRYTHPAGKCLLEALREVEARLDAINTVRSISRGFVEEGQRLLPRRAVREAVLNHLTHRDWLQPEPTTVRWIDADDTLEVTSPGGFTGGVTADNVLTTRHSRYPALSDLFRSLRLVDRQGVGVPRMYQTMLAGGHQAPVIEQTAGPRVRTTLPGKPLSPVLAGLLAVVEPAPRRRDVRVAVLIDALLRRPFLTLPDVAAVLHGSAESAKLALAAVEECHVGDVPLLVRTSTGWRFDDRIARGAAQGAYGAVPASSDLLWYRAGGSETVRRAAEYWLARNDRVTSGDIADVTGMTQPNVSTTLSSLAAAHETVARGPGKGRAAHFIRA